MKSNFIKKVNDYTRNIFKVISFGRQQIQIMIRIGKTKNIPIDIESYINLIYNKNILFVIMSYFSMV